MRGREVMELGAWVLKVLLVHNIILKDKIGDQREKDQLISLLM